MSTPTYRVFRPDPRAVDVRETHQRAGFGAHRPSSSMMVVTVDGEVDATNGRHLAGYVERQTAGVQRLVLDLRGVEFFGTAGVAALHNVHAVCRARKIAWKLLADPMVGRLVAICDPDGSLPIVVRDTQLADSAR